MTAELVVMRSPDEWAALIRRDLGQAVEGFIAAGEKLLEAKQQIRHGDWERWCREDCGVSPVTAHSFMKLAESAIANLQRAEDLPPSWTTLYELRELETPQLEAAISQGRITPDLTRDQAKALVAELLGRLPHVAKNAGDNEWYTPAEYIAAARAVMGGIDLDPATSDAANEIVGATHYYTAETNGLAHPWAGRVWMNPPYAQPLIDQFCNRLADEHTDCNVSQAVVLVNNATETRWFQRLAAVSTAMSFPRGRIRFWHPDKESAPLQGQAFIYLGGNVDEFDAAFNQFGFVMTRRGDDG